MMMIAVSSELPQTQNFCADLYDRPQSLQRITALSTCRSWCAVMRSFLARMRDSIIFFPCVNDGHCFYSFNDFSFAE
jgi:hypothetical protein